MIRTGENNFVLMHVEKTGKLKDTRIIHLSCFLIDMIDCTLTHIIHHIINLTHLVC